MGEEKISTKYIASKLGVSVTAVLKIKKRVNKELDVDWGQYDLVALDKHFETLKDVAAGIPDMVYRGVQDEDGVTSLVEVETSPTKWIATQHRGIYKDALEMMADLKEETQHSVHVVGTRRYFNSAAYTTYALYMDKVRAYGKDWMSLFGRLEESAITDALLKRKNVVEDTMDWLSDHIGEVITPALVVEYLEGLRA